MIVVHFDPPLERKDFELVLPKVQEMFPDWEWCGNTGTPTVNVREKILPGALRNKASYGDPIYTKEIGSLIHYGRFKHYGEADCLAYSGGWSEEDTKSYERQGETVKVIDGWEIVRHGSLDTEDIFNSLSESTLKRIIRESIEEFEWTKELGNYDISGWYVTKPARKWKSSKLRGNLYHITLKENNKVEVVTWPINFFLGDYQNLAEEDLFNVVMSDYLDLARHEMRHALNKITTAEGPYYWDAQDVVEYLEEGYFIKLS
jgi:hypothetical protein